jgi:hypothetical protein
MDLRVTSHLGEEEEMILPGFKTTEPPRKNYNFFLRNPKEKERAKNRGVTAVGCYPAVTGARVIC